MKISINLTDSFNFLIDYTGVSGLITYIDVAISRNMINDFKFTLFNFVLNLDDKLLQLMKNQHHDLFHHLDEDSFFIIKKAEFKLGKVKGIDIMMRNLDKEYYQTFNYALEENDSVYEVGGHSVNLPYGIINMAIISQHNVNMDFNLAECEVFNDYKLFTQRTEQLNLMINNPLQTKGKFFDIEFRAKHLNDDSQLVSL